MKFYKEKSKVKNGCPTSEVNLTKSGEIVVGKFVDRQRGDFRDMMREQMQHSLGDRYVDEVAANLLEDGGCSDGGCGIGESSCN
jgi:hypothetical protein